MWLLVFGFLIACTGKPVSSSCQLEINPPSGVVRFGDRFSSNCSSLSNQTKGMGWESTNGGVPLTNGISFLPLNIDSVTDWDLEPICYSNQADSPQCLKTLPVTVYKMPDSVSMLLPDLKGPMVEGEEYRMQCDIVKVAPVRNLSVNWYKGSEIINTQTFEESSVSPVDKSSVLKLTANRNDTGTRIWCEAKLNFLPVETIQSKPHEVTVLYPPTFSEPADEILERPAGSKIILNCTASGNPMPVYSWQVPHPMQQTNKDQNMDQPILTVSVKHRGAYNCTASNTQGSKTKHFTVIEAKGNRTTFAALVGGFVSLGAVLFIGGLFFVTPDGTFSFNKGSYIRGRSTSSGPV